MYNNTIKFLLKFLIIIGLFNIIFGIYQNLSIDENYIHYIFRVSPEIFYIKPLYHHIDTINNEYVNHILDKAHNRPWAALFLAAFYFTGISLGAFFFLVIQYISQARWIIIVSNVIESTISFIPYGGILILFILLLNGIGFLHIFNWMSLSLLENGSHYDPIIFNKRIYFNIPFYLLRGLSCISIWTFFMSRIKLISKKLYLTNSLNEYKRLYTISVIFTSFFSITSMMIGCDWVMSIDYHWLSTLFGWYVLVTFWVCGITVVVIFAFFLKKKGFLSLFNEHHLHDLTKYIFSTSLIWAYLWFSQFLLFWYGNIPEEVIYFIQRANQYGYIHLILIIPNFIFPLFGLISSKAKKKPKIVITICFVILIGHMIDIYNMIMPASVGVFYGFGAPEIGSLLFVGSIFLFIINRDFSNKKLLPLGNPLCNESAIIY